MDYEQLVRSCLSKIQYNLLRANECAEFRGQYFYPCQHCNFWHLTTQKTSYTYGNSAKEEIKRAQLRKGFKK